MTESKEISMRKVWSYFPTPFMGIKESSFFLFVRATQHFDFTFLSLIPSSYCFLKFCPGSQDNLQSPPVIYLRSYYVGLIQKNVQNVL